MKCPFCSSDETQVKDSRPTEDNTAIRRRRACISCGMRFTTFERIQLREIMVIKSNRRREPLDRDKLTRSMNIALRKRPVDPERIERAISSIIRRIETEGGAEINSNQVGELVMEALSQLDQVAYIRFASVYRNFREARDFEDFVERLNENELGD